MFKTTLASVGRVFATAIVACVVLFVISSVLVSSGPAQQCPVGPGTPAECNGDVNGDMSIDSHTTAHEGAVCAERAVNELCVGTHERTSPATVGGRVVAERAILEARRAAEDGHATALTRGVPTKHTAFESVLPAGDLDRPASAAGRVPDERAIAHRIVAGGEDPQRAAVVAAERAAVVAAKRVLPSSTVAGHILVSWIP